MRWEWMGKEGDDISGLVRSWRAGCCWQTEEFCSLMGFWCFSQQVKVNGFSFPFFSSRRAKESLELEENFGAQLAGRKGIISGVHLVFLD